MAAGDHVGAEPNQGLHYILETHREWRMAKGGPMGRLAKTDPHWPPLGHAGLPAHLMPPAEVPNSPAAVGRAPKVPDKPAGGAPSSTNRVTQAGSQWIVAQGPLSHLQFLGATKSSAKDLPLPGLEIARDSSSL